MCGFVGIINPQDQTKTLVNRVQNMMKTIIHRGPDGQGIWSDTDVGLCLGHTRLAIIDPKHGKQPLMTQDEDLVIVFNGEIYNYLELRRELIQKGHPICSYSDTEVLLYAYREWGESCVERLLGMFAFVIWDKQKKHLFCSRDRVGIKPFYYYFDGQKLVFGSEIKALLASGLLPAEVNINGLQDYLTFQFCLGDKTLFQGIQKLEPGCSLTIQVGQTGFQLHGKSYWDVTYQIDESHDEKWFVDQLNTLIEEAVRVHLRSDVPLGVYLSGGLDSTSVACLTAKMLRGESIMTFTGAFPDGEKYDETKYAKITAQSIGASYNEIYIDGSGFPDFFPNLIYMMDEPLAGPGLIPQYFVSKLAANHVKVVLGGQGGDEVFCGYTRYLVVLFENCLKKAIYNPNNNEGVQLADIISNLPYLAGYQEMIQGLLKADVFDEHDKSYFRLIDRSQGNVGLFSKEIFSNTYSTFGEYQKIFKKSSSTSLINSMLYFDLKCSLPALLHVEDRASMAASIESRIPLLDHRIIEFMATVPESIKFKHGNMKHLFKKVIQNIIPQAVYDRKDKMGFPTPLTSWLKGESKEFVYDTLLSQKARSRGIYNIDMVEKCLTDEKEFGRVVWGLLCIEIWHKTFIDNVGTLSLAA